VTVNGLRFISEHAERGARLYAQLADEVFWCETCGRTHPLREHRECRKPTHRKD
jgi:hypothetical protein